MKTPISFTETLFPYDFSEYRRWCTGDKNTIQSLLDECGTLGRTVNTYFKQGKLGQNYPEVRYAVHLVKQEGFPKENVVYENYALSLQVLNNLAGKSGLHAREHASFVRYSQTTSSMNSIAYIN